MKIFWLILTGICITAAAAFLWRDDYEKAFVVATIGAIAWFLNFRTQMTKITDVSDSDQQKIIGAENLDDD